MSQYPRVQAYQEPGSKAVLSVDGRPALTYYFGRDYPRPFIYPLLTPAGHNVLAYGHSVDLVDHSHHRGLFIAHGKTNDEDFWSDQANRCIHQKLLKLDSGTESGTIGSLNHWVAGEQVLLEENREFALGVNYELTVRLEFTATDTDVELGENKFGFLALRVLRSIGVAAGGGRITDSEGRKNEEEVFGQTATWCDYSGPVSSTEWAGVTVHDAPGNPRHPTNWMCRNDGWFSPAFNMSEPYTIKEGETLTLSYRVIPHDGASPVAT